MSKILITICISLLLVSTTYAGIIGNWENTSGDGWGGWISNNVVAANPLPITLSNGVTYSQSTIGATLGSDSLDVTQSGWAQSLAISLNSTQTADFMSHNTFSIDMTVAAAGPTITGGYSQIYSVAMNAGGPGYTTVASGNPINFYWWAGSGQRTQTLNVDYTSFRNAMTESSWCQIIITLNTGGGAPPDMYFDNARLTGVPEPATMALLGLGGLALIRRKR